MVQTIQAVNTSPTVATINDNASNDANVVASVQKADSNQKQTLSKEDMDAVVKELNKAMEIVGTSLSFSIDQATRELVVKVTDVKTKEVIRQIPSAEMLRVSQRIAELLGVLYDHAG